MTQALYKITQNKGYPIGDCSFLEDVDYTDELLKVVSVAKVCNTFTECAGNNYKRLNDVDWSVLNRKSIVTSDGQII